MPRFFYPETLTIGQTITLPEAVSHHVNVLRLAPGAHITLFNGQGGEYVASITEMERKRTYAEIKTFSPTEAELPYGITLAQGLPEGSKMDWIIEKAMELGATAIQPLAAQRSVVKLSGDRIEKRRQHWQSVIISAAEQCGRNRLAHLGELSDFNSWISQQDLHKRLLLSPRATQSLSDWARHHPPQAVAVVIGPEGGLTEAEEELAARHGAILVQAGPRILRTETAGLAAIAAINACWGEI